MPSYLDYHGLQTFKGELDEIFETKMDADKRGANNGVASLDENGKVPLSQLPGGGGGGTDIIDDTATYGDTDKAWSADKLEKKFRDAKNNPVFTGGIIFGHGNVSEADSISVSEWAQNTEYVVGDIRSIDITPRPNPSGEYWFDIYRCKTAHTSGNTFDVTKWDLIGSQSTEESTASLPYKEFAEVVGNGWGNGLQSNARTLDWHGNEKLAGDLTLFAGTENEVSVSELRSTLAPKANPVFTRSVSMGRYGTSGSNSTALGSSAEASGSDSFAEGAVTTASGSASHASGQNTTASGTASFASGQGTIANHKGQHAFGLWNVADDSSAAATAVGNYIEIVGNGSDQGHRSNARTLDKDGNEELAGDLTVFAGTNDEVSVSELKNAISYTGKIFDTVALMVADTSLKAGDNVATKGYYTSGDNGGTNYVIANSHTGVFYITLSNGLYANLLTEKGVLPAESIGIKSYAASTQNPDNDDMTRNVTLFNTAIYNGVYLLFGKGYFYFNSAVQLAHKNTYTIRGLAREVTHLFFPSSDGFYFSDPIYYNYYVIKGMHIHSYGNTIGCAPNCLTVLDSHFEWLQLESETGNCFDAPTYNVAKYINQGGTTIYDTCVQNCVFDFVNASAPSGAAFCNIMGMYNYYRHMNFVSCKYAFRNCDGIVEQTNTLGTQEDYFIYYDKTNSHSLRWTFINVNAEGLAKAFIFTEPEANAGEGEDPRKPETANHMTIAQITAINSGWSLYGVESGHNIYPITVHQLNMISLINSDNIIQPSQYPAVYDTDAVKAQIHCTRSSALNRYDGGPDLNIFYNNNVHRRFGSSPVRVNLTNGNNGGYNTIVNRNMPLFTEFYSERIFGGKNLDVWDTKTSVTTTSQPEPPFEKAFCDVISFDVDTNSDKSLIRIASNYESNYTGRVITLENKKTSLHNLIISNVNTNRANNNYSLTKDCFYSVILSPGESVKLEAVYETSAVNGNILIVWKPLKYKHLRNDKLDLNLYEVAKRTSSKTILAVTDGYCYPTNSTSVDIANPTATSVSSGTYGLKCAIATCSEGDEFTIINGHGSANQRLWAFTTETGFKITTADNNLGLDSEGPFVITAPAQAAYLVVNSHTYPIVFKSN